MTSKTFHWIAIVLTIVILHIIYVESKPGENTTQTRKVSPMKDKSHLPRKHNLHVGKDIAKMNNDIRNFNIPGFYVAESELLHKMLQLIKIPITSEKKNKTGRSKDVHKSSF